MHALCIEIEQLQGHAHRRAGVQFAQVADMRLESREGGMPRFFQINELRSP